MGASDLTVAECFAIISSGASFLLASAMAFRRFEFVRCLGWAALAGFSVTHEACGFGGACSQPDFVAPTFATLLLWTVASNILLAGVFDMYLKEVLLEVLLAGLSVWFIHASNENEDIWPYFTMVAVAVFVSWTTRFWNKPPFMEHGANFMPMHHTELICCGLPVAFFGFYVVLQATGVAFGHAARDVDQDTAKAEWFRAAGYAGWGIGSAMMIYVTRVPQKMDDYHLGTDL